MGPSSLHHLSSPLSSLLLLHLSVLADCCWLPETPPCDELWLRARMAWRRLGRCDRRCPGPAWPCLSSDTEFVVTGCLHGNRAVTGCWASKRKKNTCMLPNWCWEGLSTYAAAEMTVQVGLYVISLKRNIQKWGSWKKREENEIKNSKTNWRRHKFKEQGRKEKFSKERRQKKIKRTRN